jgi:Got1/Sft2-like family
MFESVDFRSLLQTESQQDTTEEECVPRLNFRERVIGCVSCMVLGYLLSFGSFFRLKDLVQGNPIPFVLNSTIGNIIALAGSCFFSGPKTQIAKMTSESRRLASFAYISSLVMTLVVALAPIPGPKGLLLLLLLIIQYVSVFWYCLSYIPFARDAVKGFIYHMVGDGD